MSTEPHLEIHPAWENLPLDALHGVLMVIGALDVGKSTLARYLFERLQQARPSNQEQRSLAYIDGDPGQTNLGPPTTITACMATLDLCGNRNSTPGDNKLRRYFIGSTSPRGHMLPMVVGAARLVQAAGADTLVYDTCGLVDPAQGGQALKMAKIDLLQPTTILAIQRQHELESLLIPLRRSDRVRVISLRPAAAVHRKANTHRRAHRQQKYAAHFNGSRVIEVGWSQLAVFPAPRFSLQRLVAFQDAAGFTLALGIVREIDRQARKVSILTPLASLEGVRSLRLGDIKVDPHSFQDQMIGR
jgi:polynucleotide 5'-hydroxyl-kinase GRC3/NOL9